MPPRPAKPGGAGGAGCLGQMRASPIVDGEPVGLWEQPIAGQLRLALEPARGPVPVVARTPAPTPPQSAVGAASSGGLVLCFEDRDAGRHGMLRWYGIHLQERLDGGVDVIRRWGRLGHRATHPHQLTDAYPDWASAQQALTRLLAQRAARGYQPARPG